jgi:hypothetical protein
LFIKGNGEKIEGLFKNDLFVGDIRILSKQHKI